jgi:uncharacterized protein with HEPN domain
MKDARLYLLHMSECIERIERYVARVADIADDGMVLDAVLRNLQTMSEASQRLPDPLKGRHEDVPWSRIAGFRNILVHGYLGGIDITVVRNVLASELPRLKEVLRIELASGDRDCP